MESDFRTLLLTYMYTNLSEETKVLSNKITFAHEKNQSNPSIFVAQPVKWMNLIDSKLSVRINKLFLYLPDTSVSSC